MYLLIRTPIDVPALASETNTASLPLSKYIFSATEATAFAVRLAYNFNVFLYMSM